MAKWTPLTEWLESCGQDRVLLSVTDLEEILGAAVPASARRHRQAFWSNGRSSRYARVWRAAGYRAEVRGYPEDVVAFVRDERPDLVLVGCVTSQAGEPRPARELFTSPLFARRRAYAEASGAPWAVLSAERGLVLPDEVIKPYAQRLIDRPAAQRERWGQQVAEHAEQLFGPLAGQRIELHAGTSHVRPLHGLLEERGAIVVWPFEGCGLGAHLAWYRPGHA